MVVELLHTSPWASALAVAGRWLLYGGSCVLIGAATTSLIVYGGRLPGGGVPVLRTAAAVAVAGLACMVWAEKVLIGAPSLLPLFVMRQGLLLLGLAVALVLCITAVVLVDLWPARWSLWLLGAFGAAAVAVHVAAGHAASPASVGVLNITLQWVHMTAIGRLGRRAVLAAARVPRPGRGRAGGRRRRLHAHRHGPLVVVLATGVVRAVVEVGSVSALFDTGYGITLVVKIALVAGLVGLGALNHFFWVPAVRGGGAERERRFGLNSRGELAVALAVLAATAVLSGLAPARTAAAVKSGAGQRPAGQVTASGSDYATSVRVDADAHAGRRRAATPTCCGWTTTTPATRSTTVTAVERSARCRPRRPCGPVSVQLSQASDGSWTGGGLDFSVAGRWQVVVSVQEKTGGTTVRLEVTMRPAPAP